MLFLFILLSLLAALLGLPVLKLIFMTGYLAIFAAIFALSGMSVLQVEPWVIILKAVTAAFGLLILFSTTNYFEIFAALALFLPRLILDVLFTTYRSFFILLKELNDLLIALKVRGGLAPKRFINNLKNLGSILGTLLIHALDMSSRSSSILKIRGYRGGIAHHHSKRGATFHDILPILLGLGIMAGAWIRA